MTSVVAVFYVSGHGLGHAVRAAEVARALARRGTRVILRSDASPEAFAPLPATVRLEHAAVDVGVVQRSAIAGDEKATLDRFGGFAARLPALARSEAEGLRRAGAQVVVADIAPLGVLAAAAAGIPSVVVANFSWDWIYAGWSDLDARAHDLAEVVASAYRQTTLLLETPLSGGLTAFPRRERVPLIVRRAERGRAEVRGALGVAPDEIAAFVAFGGFGPPVMGEPHDVADLPVRFLSYADLGWSKVRFERVDRGRFSHPELVQAADVLVGKPGYGTVAECAAHATPMLWVGRDRFREVEVLKQGIAEYAGGAEITAEDLARGRLKDGLVRALSTPPRGPAPAMDGADVAAERILALALPG